MKVFGLTGGIGSGKSSVSRIWNELGLPVIDADQLSRDVVVPGSDGLWKVIDYFGQDFLNDDGTLNRKKMADLVFNDAKALHKLNYILHPYIEELCYVKQDALRKSGAELVVYDSPLLFEAREQYKFTPVVVVTVTPEQQIYRSMLRDGTNREDVLLRMNAQMPLHEKVKQAHVVIDNSGTYEDLKGQAMLALEKVRKIVGS